MTRGQTLVLRNVFILLGIIVTVIGLIYFASELIDRLSDVGRVLSLVLLTVMFVSLGRHFEGSSEGDEVVDRAGWRWLRVTSALYLLGLVASVTAVFVFLALDGLDPLAKAGATLFVGLGLILWAARRFGARD